MSFTVDESDAVAGALQAGDRIDVVAVAHDGKDAGYVLVGAPVLAAARGRWYERAAAHERRRDRDHGVGVRRGCAAPRRRAGERPRSS